jgi:hypothetical protein
VTRHNLPINEYIWYLIPVYVNTACSPDLNVALSLVLLDLTTDGCEMSATTIFARSRWLCPGSE